MDLLNLNTLTDLENRPLALASKLRSALSVANSLLGDSASLTYDDVATIKAKTEALKATLVNRQINLSEIKTAVLQSLDKQVDELLAEDVTLELLQDCISYDRQCIEAKISEIQLLVSWINNRE